MTVLVTGGLGYLGSALIRALPRHPDFGGREIRIFDNLRQPRYHSLWDLPTDVDYSFVEGDVRDRETVAAAMEDVDVVFHLAAITNAPETFDIPEKTRDVNYRGALNVYEAAVEHDVSRFVNVSTCSVYGRTDERIAESFDCDPESPYGVAKYDAEQAMLDRSDSMHVTALRLGTVYGWTPGMRFDTVVDKFAYLAATGQPLTVYRNAQEQKRPYLHVRDAIRSMLFAAAELDDREVYNVVTENATLGTVVETIESEFDGVEIDYVDVERLNQLSYVVSDGKIRDAGFEPSYSLQRGVEELADKFRALGRPSVDVDG